MIQILFYSSPNAQPIEIGTKIIDFPVIHRAIESAGFDAGVVMVDSLAMSAPELTMGQYLNDNTLQSLTNPYRVEIDLFGNRVFTGFVDIESVSFNYETKVYSFTVFDALGALAQFDGRPPRLNYTNTLNIPTSASANRIADDILEFVIIGQFGSPLFRSGCAFSFNDTKESFIIKNQVSWFYDAPNGATYVRLKTDRNLPDPLPTGGAVFYDENVYGTDILIYNGIKNLSPPYPDALFVDIIKLLDALISAQFPQSIFENQTGATEIPVSLIYAADIVRDVWETHPIEVIKKIIPFISAWFFADASGCYILKKKEFTNLPAPTVTLDPIVLRCIKKYNWLSTYDGVEVELVHQFASYFSTITRNDRTPKNVIEKKVFYSGDPLVSPYQEASNVANSIFNIYCKRRCFYSAQVQLTAAVSSLDLTQTVSIFGRMCIITSIAFNLSDLTAEIEMVDAEGFYTPNLFN